MLELYKKGKTSKMMSYKYRDVYMMIYSHSECFCLLISVLHLFQCLCSSLLFLKEKKNYQNIQQNILAYFEEFGSWF